MGLETEIQELGLDFVYLEMACNFVLNICVLKASWLTGLDGFVIGVSVSLVAS